MPGFDLHLHTEWSYDAVNPIELYFGAPSRTATPTLWTRAS